MPRFKRDRFERVGDNLILDQIGGETKSIFEMRTIMVTDLARGLATDLWSDRFIRLDREKISIILNSVSNVLVWVGQGFSFNDSELRIVTAVCRLISYERSDDSSKVLEFVYARLHAHSYAEKRFG